MNYIRTLFTLAVMGCIYGLWFVHSAQALTGEDITRQYFLNKNLLYLNNNGKPEVNDKTGEAIRTDIFTCGCPVLGTDANGDPLIAENCVYNTDLWSSAPLQYHAYVPDPDATAVVQGNIRAQQFLDWTLTVKHFYNFDEIIRLWKQNQGIALILLLAVTALITFVAMARQFIDKGSKFSLGTIISNVVVTTILIVFSFALTSGFAQISDIFTTILRGGWNASSVARMTQMNVSLDVTKGSHEALKGNNLSENYRLNGMVCQDLNMRTLENANTIKKSISTATVSYYTLAFFTILRVIVFWFLIIIAPLVFIFYPFAAGKKVIESWLTIFSIFALHGPLQSLTINIVHELWNRGIPLTFFNSTNPNNMTYYPAFIQGYIGGPSNFQKVDFVNNVNQIGSFAEFVVGMIMLWVALILPWLIIVGLRKFFRDNSDALGSQMFTVWQEIRGIGGNGGSSSGSHERSLINTITERFIPKHLNTTTQTTTKIVENGVRVPAQQDARGTTVSAAPSMLPSNVTSAPIMTAGTLPQRGVQEQISPPTITLMSSSSSSVTSPRFEKHIIEISSRTGHDAQTVQKVFSSYETQTNKTTLHERVQEVSKTINVDEQTVTQILKEGFEQVRIAEGQVAPHLQQQLSSAFAEKGRNLLSSSEPLSATLSKDIGISVQPIITESLEHADVKQEIASNGIPQEEAKAVGDVLKHHLDDNGEVLLAASSSETGMEPAKSKNILETIFEALHNLFSHNKGVYIEDTLIFPTLTQQHLQELVRVTHDTYNTIYPDPAHDSSRITLELQTLEATLKRLMDPNPDIVIQGQDMLKALIPADVLQTATQEECMGILYARMKVLRRIKTA